MLSVLVCVVLCLSGSVIHAENDAEKEAWALKTEDQAVSTALAATGFSRLTHYQVPATKAAELVVLEDDQTPFLHDQINGTANYFQFPNLINPDWCDVYLSSCDNFADAGKNATLGSAMYSQRVEVPVFANDCFQNCCTDQELDKGWYYATAKRDTADIVEAKSYIESRYGQLCGESVPVDDYSHMVVFVGITNIVGGTTQLSAQTGYIRRRQDGDTHTTIGRYAELLWVTDDGIVVDSMYHGSFEGAQRTYSLKLDKTTGEWKFYDNGIKWLQWPPQPEWVGKTGNSVQWTGEIYGRETDMAGTLANTCVMDACFFRFDGDVVWYDGGFFNPGIDIGGTDLNEWNITPIHQSTIEIYDAKTLP